MSSYGDVLAISATGMQLERLRLEVAANNLANAHSTVGPHGEPYRPLRVVGYASTGPIEADFERRLAGTAVDPAGLRGVAKVDVLPMAAVPKEELDPGNPAADSKGFVKVPGINPVEEMLTVMTSVRAYEANVRVMNAAKSMAVKALEIGASS